MTELDQLDRSHAEFARRGVKVVAISPDDLPNAKATQDRFIHLVIVSDPEQSLAKSAAVVHKGVGPGGADTNVPATFLIDSTGQVRAVHRAENFFVRQGADKLLAAVDETLAAKAK